MHNEDAVGESGSSGSAPVLDRPARSARPGDMDVVTFLQTALASGMANVPELEILARAAGLLGEHQRISQSKQFKRAKITLGIQSVRQGFGPAGGWAWVLPPPANAPASETKPKEPVIRAEPERGAIYGDGIVGAATMIVGAATMGSLIDDVEMPPEFRDIVGVETTGKRTPDAEFIRKQPFAWRAPGIIIEVHRIRPADLKNAPRLAQC